METVKNVEKTIYDHAEELKFPEEFKMILKLLEKEGIARFYRSSGGNNHQQFKNLCIILNNKIMVDLFVKYVPEYKKKEYIAFKIPIDDEFFFQVDAYGDIAKHYKVKQCEVGSDLSQFVLDLKRIKDLLNNEENPF